MFAFSSLQGAMLLDNARAAGNKKCVCLEVYRLCMHLSPSVLIGFTQLHAVYGTGLVDLAGQAVIESVGR
jgi:hypothetical protein